MKNLQKLIFNESNEKIKVIETRNLFTDKIHLDSSYIKYDKINSIVSYETMRPDVIRSMIITKKIFNRNSHVEELIKDDPRLCYLYAKNTIQGRFPLGEKVLAGSIPYCYTYARDVIGGRFPECEKEILKHPQYIRMYTRDVIKGPWPEGEKALESYVDLDD